MDSVNTDLRNYNYSNSVLKHEEIEHQENTTAKVIAMIVLFSISLLFGLIPFIIAKLFKRSKKLSEKFSITAVTILLAFGGGVLLCTTFMHLVPEVNENIIVLQELNLIPVVNFNIAELLMCLGFFSMYLIEEIIHAYLHKYQQKCSPDLENGVDIRERKISNNSNCIDNDNLPEKFISFNKLKSQKNESNQTVDMCKGNPSIKNTLHTDVPAGNHHHGGHAHLAKANPHEPIIVSSLRGLLIVLALSIHELFEGLAVGLESHDTNVWYMFGAVAAHKFVLAFCVGVELKVSGTRLILSVLYIFTFAAVSPIGIGIGILISETSSTNTSMIASVVLQGLASGTLLYVVFFEILSKDRSGLMQYVAVLMGFSIMFGLSFLTEHTHIHNDDINGINLD